MSPPGRLAGADASPARPPGTPRDARIRTGEVVHLRPITPEDATSLVAFHADLSPLSVYLRFLSYHPVLSEREADWFTSVDGRDRVAFVVESAGRLLGVGRYDRVPSTCDAEVAFVVADDHQGAGIGTLLADELARTARAYGIDTFVAETLTENSGMLEVFFTLGFPVTSTRAGDVVRLRFPIHPVPAYRQRLAKREAARAVTPPPGHPGDAVPEPPS